MSNDRGFVTVWTVAITATMFFILAFTLDAGRVVRANSEAYGTAAAAARRAVNQIDEAEAVQSGDLQLVEGLAVEAAQAYCNDREYTCQVVVDVTALTAEVTASPNEFELHLPGVPVPEISVHASAQAVQVPG